MAKSIIHMLFPETIASTLSGQACITFSPTSQNNWRWLRNGATGIKIWPHDMREEFLQRKVVVVTRRRDLVWNVTNRQKLSQSTLVLFIFQDSLLNFNLVVCRNSALYLFQHLSYKLLISVRIRFHCKSYKTPNNSDFDRILFFSSCIKV